MQLLKYCCYLFLSNSNTSHFYLKLLLGLSRCWCVYFECVWRWTGLTFHSLPTEQGPGFLNSWRILFLNVMFDVESLFVNGAVVLMDPPFPDFWRDLFSHWDTWFCLCSVIFFSVTFLILPSNFHMICVGFVCLFWPCPCSCCL